MHRRQGATNARTGMAQDSSQATQVLVPSLPVFEGLVRVSLGYGALSSKWRDRGLDKESTKIFLGEFPDP